MSIPSQTLHQPYITESIHNNCGIQSQKIGDIYFIHNAFTICESCFWCATTNEDFSFDVCPACKKSKVDTIPLLGAFPKCNLDIIKTLFFDKEV